MTKLTKVELVQINARLAAENEALRKQVLDLQHDMARAQFPAQRARAEYNMPQWQVDRAQAMAAAKALAMSHGVPVKV